MFLPNLLIYNPLTRLSTLEILPRAYQTQLGDDPEDGTNTDDPFFLFLVPVSGGCRCGRWSGIGRGEDVE